MPASDPVTLTHDERGSGPPVLLIMGIGAQLVLWQEGVCDRLAAAGFRVVRFDNRDCGTSTRLEHLPAPSPARALAAALAGRPLAAPYSLEDMADDVVGLMDQLHLDTAHVVGVSMGGMIAQCLAIQHPDRIRSLTSMFSTTGGIRASVGKPRAYRALLSMRTHALEPYVASFTQFTQTVGGSLHPSDPAVARQLATLQFSRGVYRAGFKRQWAAILANGDRTNRLQAVTTPTLVVHGEEDPLVPLSGGIATARAVPGARLVVVPGLGHSMPQSAWPLIFDPIVDHLRRADDALGSDP